MREKAVTRDDLAKQVNVPLPLSLYAQLVVADVKPAGGAAMPASHFAVPDEYEEMDSAQDVQRLLRPGRAGHGVSAGAGGPGRAGHGSLRAEGAKVPR